MTHTIELTPDMEARLHEEAARRGQNPDDLVRLAVEKLLGLSIPAQPGRAWSEIEGAATFPMVGEDAQAWITRTRREGDEQRERLLRREPGQTQDAL